MKGDKIYADKEYYLANTQGGATCGNSLKWWAIGGRGYTSDIRYAEVFKGTDPKLRSLRECDIPLLKDDMDKLVQHHVDIQDLRKDQNGRRRDAAHTTLFYKQFLGGEK